MPAVTVKLNSSGLPIASTHSPTRVGDGHERLADVGRRLGGGDLERGPPRRLRLGDEGRRAALPGQIERGRERQPEDEGQGYQGPEFQPVSRTHRHRCLLYFFLSSSTIS